MIQGSIYRTMLDNQLLNYISTWQDVHGLTLAVAYLVLEGTASSALCWEWNRYSPFCSTGYWSTLQNSAMSKYLLV